MGISWGLLLLCLVFAVAIAMGLVIGLIVAASRHTAGSQQSTIPSGRRSAQDSIIGRVVGCWIAPSAVMGAFFAMSGTSLYRQQVEEARPVTPPAISETHSNSKVIPVSDSESSRPAWTQLTEETNGEVRRITLASALWSTEPEAQAELQWRAAGLIRNDFHERHHGLLDPDTHRFLTDARAIDVAVKDRFVERRDQDFGTFNAPMVRVWWQVELSPMVRTEIYPAWRSAVVQNRILTVGAGLALLTLLANSARLFARIQRNTIGSRFRAATVASLAAGAWIAGDLLLMSRLLA